MSIDTHVDDALVRVQAERGAVDEELEAFDRFTARVAGIDPVTPADRSMGVPVADGGGTAATATTRDQPGTCCDRLRDAFAETVYGTIDDDLSLTAAMSEDLSEEVALALSPETTHRFTPPVKQTVLAATEKRETELGALKKALSREEDSVRTAAGELDEITAWLAAADETPLLDVGFEQLRERHERLSRYRERCEEVARRRQQTLATTTSNGGAAGIEHRTVVDYLYSDFPTTHPVLSTATTLADLCGDCQETVRDHLTRRV